MAKLVHIRGCGPMVASDYREIGAAIDRAYAGPRHAPLRWRGVSAQLDAGVERTANPLPGIAALEIDGVPPADLGPSPAGDVTPG